MLADSLEELADEAVRRPVGQADLAAVLADADQFGGGAILVGREHDAEGRDDNVETRVGEGQRFGVGLAEFDVEPFGRGALAGALEQCRHVVGGDHVAPTACGRERDVAVAGGDVEHLLSRPEVEGFAQLFTDDLQRGADDGIVAGGPGALLAGFHRPEIDWGERPVLACCSGGCCHASLSIEAVRPAMLWLCPSISSQ